VLAAAALAATTPRPAAARRAGRDAVGPVSDRRALPWRSRPAWLLAAYLAAQSSLAYAALAWLPTWHIATGGTPGGGGAVLAVHNVAQLVAALGVPVLADRCADRRTVLVPVLLCSVAGTVWLVAFPGSLTLVAAVVLGAGLGAGFALGLTLVVDLAADPPAAAALAAFVFLLCYSVAAAAPVTVGVLADVVGLRAALAGLVVVAVVQLALATRLGPGHDGTVTCRVLRGHRRRQRVERPTR
jgi:MFS transporter, CP family, cyanate transporter